MDYKEKSIRERYPAEAFPEMEIVSGELTLPENPIEGMRIAHVLGYKHARIYGYFRGKWSQVEVDFYPKNEED